MENAVPLAASLGTEQASAVWSLNQAQANLACRGLWRISLMKYIYDLLQTCIVPRYCVLSGWLRPDVFPAWQSETVQGRMCGTDAQGMLRGSIQRKTTEEMTHISPGAHYHKELLIFHVLMQFSVLVFQPDLLCFSYLKGKN